MLPSKLEVIGIKTETTQNTAATLAATDFFLAADVSFKPVAEFIPRDYKHASLDRLAHILGQVYVDISFKQELHGSGAAGTALAPLSAALQAAKLSETVSASTSVTYAPTSVPASSNFFSPGKSATIELYEGSTTSQSGLKKVIKGCVASGGPKLVVEKNKVPMVEFSFRGLYTAPTDAVRPTVTLSSIDPPRVESITFSSHTYSAFISKVEVDLGCVAAIRDDLNSAESVKGFSITDWDPKGSFDPEVELAATHDFYGKFKSGAQAQISFVVGATAGNITTVTMPKCQYMIPEMGDRSGIRIFQLPFRILQNSGDDCISIVQT